MALVVTATWWSLGGCADVPVGDTDSVAKAESNLYRYPNITPWENGTVPVCFANITAETTDEIPWVKSALKNTWSSVAKVNFQFLDTCPATFNPGVKFVFNVAFNDSWYMGGTTLGAGTGSYELRMSHCTMASCAPGQADYVDYEENFKASVAHEFGHALGFAHEQQRPDYVAHDCPGDDGTGQSVTIDGGTYLTSSFDRDSIMNYCRRYTTIDLKGQAGYLGADRLSPGDTFGAQQMYGARFAYWLGPAVRVATL